MRRFFTFIAVIITIIFLFAGHTYWKHKTTSVSVVKESGNSTTVTAKEKKDDEKAKEPVFDEKKLEKAANWPEKAQTAFEKAMLNEKAFKVALVGSEALGKDANGWSVQLQEALADAYGDALDVKIFQYEERSDGFINSGHDKEVAKFKPDVILFEPFTLNDNGNVEVEDSHQNIETFLSSIEKENNEAVVILQPPHPIHNATIYPWQVEELEKFAGNHNLTFLNHWPEWPDPENEELRSYLLEDQSAPNKKGHEVWFAFLKKYFIAE